MAKKIEGYGANRFGEYQFDVAPDENDGWSMATLVIGDERVFTESEVKAIAIQAISMIKAAAKTGIHVGQACGYIGKSCADAGITLDPA